MDENNRKKIWYFAMKEIADHRDIGEYDGNKELQKKQFLTYRKELITFLNQKLSAGEVTDINRVHGNIREQ